MVCIYISVHCVCVQVYLHTEKLYMKNLKINLTFKMCVQNEWRLHKMKTQTNENTSFTSLKSTLNLFSLMKWEASDEMWGVTVQRNNISKKRMNYILLLWKIRHQRAALFHRLSDLKVSARLQTQCFKRTWYWGSDIIKNRCVYYEQSYFWNSPHLIGRLFNCLFIRWKWDLQRWMWKYLCSIPRSIPIKASRERVGKIARVR